MIDYTKLETSTLLRRRTAVEEDLRAIERALAARGNPANNYGNSLSSSLTQTAGLLTSQESSNGNYQTAASPG